MISTNAVLSMLIHNIKFKSFLVLLCKMEVLTVLFLKTNASCDVTLCHRASSYQVLKASYSFKKLETTQGMTWHHILMRCNSVLLGSTQRMTECHFPEDGNLHSCHACGFQHTFHTKCMLIIYLILNYTCPK